MATEKRERQRANRRRKMEQEAAVEKQQQNRSRIYLVGGLIVAGLLAAFLYSVFAGGGDDGSDETQTDQGSLEENEAADDEPSGDDADDTARDDADDDSGEIVAPPAGGEITGETPCPEADGSAERITSFENAPPMCLDPDTSYQAVLTTTEGEIVIDLDAENFPITVNNFVVLSRYRFYDGIPFHRIVSGFVAQAGDPGNGSSMGTGGPGYTIDGEVPDEGFSYSDGVVAMANTGDPDTTGSQFFVVVDSNLGPNFNVLGEVVEGYDTTVAAIMEYGVDNQAGVPTGVVTIESVEIIEG